MGARSAEGKGQAHHLQGPSCRAGQGWVVRSSPLAAVREPPSPGPSESRGIAFQNPARGRQRRGSQAEESRLAQGPSLTREAPTDTAGPVGRPLAICPLESLVSAQDGAADRVGKKGFAEKGLFYCNYLESESQGGGGGGSTIN